MNMDEFAEADGRRLTWPPEILALCRRAVDERQGKAPEQFAWLLAQPELKKLAREHRKTLVLMGLRDCLHAARSGHNTGTLAGNTNREQVPPEPAPKRDVPRQRVDHFSPTAQAIYQGCLSLNINGTTIGQMTRPVLRRTLEGQRRQRAASDFYVRLLERLQDECGFKDDETEVGQLITHERAEVIRKEEQGRD